MLTWEKNESGYVAEYVSENFAYIFIISYLPANPSVPPFHLQLQLCDLQDAILGENSLGSFYSMRDAQNTASFIVDTVIKAASMERKRLNALN